MEPSLQIQLGRVFADGLLLTAGYRIPARRAAAAAQYAGWGLEKIGRALIQGQTRGAFDGGGNWFGEARKLLAFNETLIVFLRDATLTEYLANDASTATKWCRLRAISRFDDLVQPLRIRSDSVLPKIGDSGALDTIGLATDTERRSIEPRGKRFYLPRQAVYNASMGELFDIPKGMAELVHNSIDGEVYEALLGADGRGPLMDEDGKYLCDDTRSPANRLTGSTSVLSTSSFQQAAKLLRSITSKNGIALNSAVRSMIVPTTLAETAAEVLRKLGLGGPDPARPIDRRSPTATLLPGVVDLITEPRLDAGINGSTAWYLAAAPSRQGVEICSLGSDAPRPLVTPAPEGKKLALAFDLLIDSSVTITDWRGLVRAEGQ